MKKMKRALLLVPVALVVMGLGLMYNNGDIPMVTTKRSSKKVGGRAVTPIPTQDPPDQWTSESPQSSLDGVMATLSRSNGGIAFFPPYYVNTSVSSSDAQTPPPRLYPYGYYPTRSPYYNSYRNRYYPTRSPYYNRYYNQYYPTRSPYYNRYYNQYYPTRSPYYNRFYPTQPYYNRFYPTQPYYNRFYPTRSPYYNRFYEDKSESEKVYPTQPYPYYQFTAQYPHRTTTSPTTTSPTTTWNYPTTTWNYPYPTSRYPYWTTPPTTPGVSVCVRYLTDLDQRTTIFNLSPGSKTTMRVTVSPDGWYTLIWDFSYYTLSLKPNKRFWSGAGSDLWTKLCLTVDTISNVAQVFSGSTMSIRKFVPFQYVWSGEPTIEFGGFDGQVTDVQMWDYPLRYYEVYNYMSGGSSGSVLTWSNIRYTIRGKALLERRYENMRENEMSIKKKKERRPKGERKTKKYFKEIGRRERKKLSQLQ